MKFEMSYLLYAIQLTIHKSKVDGMDSLIEYISTKQFIKLAIESSYFSRQNL